jgi:hypothetical protein
MTAIPRTLTRGDRLLGIHDATIAPSVTLGAAILERRCQNAG